MAAASPPTSEFCVARSPEEKLLLVESPLDYPCFKEDGFFKPTSACRKRCCVVPPKTPEGEDSPKWQAHLAQEAIIQPHFGVTTPDKTISFTHNSVTGDTPLHMPGWF